jgi:putative flavoprotein involved in K+ transport
MAAAPTVVVGAGPAGLAAAAMLRARGMAAIVLEREAALGASWRGHYDSLRLHTVRSLSGLPGMRIARANGRWVGRAAFVDYLDAYAASRGVAIHTETAVHRVDRTPGGLVLETSAGPIEAPAVVIATGYNREPAVPGWPGAEEFPGPVVHSSEYRNAEPYAGRRVLVAGAGNSGSDIALDLLRGGARHVCVAVRTPPGIVPRQALGLPAQVAAIPLSHTPALLADAVAGLERRLLIGDAGLGRAPEGVFRRHRRQGVLPILDHGFAAAVKAGEIPIVPAVEALAADGARLHGGAHAHADAIVAATGYRPALRGLVGHLGVLDDAGLPLRHGGDAHPDVPGLHFTGFRNPITGALRELRFEAAAIADALALPARASAVF